MIKKKIAKTTTFLRCVAVVIVMGVEGISVMGQSAHEGEWTRYHPHFMGHRDTAAIELRARRQVVAIESVRQREALTLEVELKRGRRQNQFDLYVALSLEGATRPFDDRVLFLNRAGEYANRPQPYEAQVELREDRQLTVRVPLYSGMPPRAYTIYGVLVEPGRDPLEPGHWIEMAAATFALRRAMSQPIEVSEQGNLYVGRDRTFPRPAWLPPGPLVVGPLGTQQGMYVNYQAPAQRRQPYPIVYVHG